MRMHMRMHMHMHMRMRMRMHMHMDMHMVRSQAARVGAVVPGAPLAAGGALLYDYRLVHAGSPNEGRCAEGGEGGAEGGGVEGSAEGGVEGGGVEGGVEGGEEGGGEGGEGGERPILQLTYSRGGYRDRFRNYGFEQLFCD